jgi:PAT family beta-lactamase induction signal transducer AmpG
VSRPTLILLICLAAGTALILSSIGKDNPLASTQFAILNAALATPLIYMQWIDGHAYGTWGLAGLYLTDGGLDLAACILMIGLFLVWSRPRWFAASAEART